MHTIPWLAALACATCVTVTVVPQRSSAAPPGDEAAYPDPARFADEIDAFTAADSVSPPPTGAIVCVGSSSMHGWHETIAQDLAPLTVVPRGFGGSNMNDVLFYADMIILPYHPRAVVLYEGDNDIADGVAPGTIDATFGKLVARIRAELPLCRIYVLSIKPSPSRWTLWPRMQRANALLRADCADDSLLTYVDVAGAMLGQDGKPKPDIFLEDRLHMNRAGYRLWRDALRPVLLGREEQDEDDLVRGKVAK